MPAASKKPATKEEPEAEAEAEAEVQAPYTLSDVDPLDYVGQPDAGVGDPLTTTEYPAIPESEWASTVIAGA